MVGAVDSGSRGLGLSSCRCSALCSWAIHFTLKILLFTQVYKWESANLMLGVAVRFTSTPSLEGRGGGGGVKRLLVASCHTNWDNFRPDWSHGSYADVTYVVQLYFSLSKLPRKLMVPLFVSWQGLTAPMQGFFNCIVYGWSRKSFREASEQRRHVLGDSGEYVSPQGRKTSYGSMRSL